MRPLLFLDLDGVLNNNAWLKLSRQKRAEGIRDHRAHVRRVADAVSPELVVRLNTICAETPELRIVWSSTWRLYEPLPTLLDGLRARGYNGPDITDRTADLSIVRPGGVSVSPDRGDEINAWRAHNIDGPIAPFVVLDDDRVTLHAEHQHRLVRTDFEHGLTAEHAQRAIELLRTPL